MLLSLISQGIDFTKRSTEKSEQVFLEEAAYVIHVIFFMEFYVSFNTQDFVLF